MTIHSAFEIPVGSLTFTVPAGRQAVPGLMWGNLALAGLLDAHGYEEAAQATLEKLGGWLSTPLEDLQFPGEHLKRIGRKLTDGAQPGDERLSWYVCRSATRQEKRAEEGLVEAGMVVYVPRLITWRRTARKKTKIDRPLLGGYIFVGIRSRTHDRDGHDEDINAITAVEGVHAMIRFTNDRAPLQVPFLGDEGVMSILQQELAGDFDKTRTRNRKPDPKKGDRVKVTSGMFKVFPAEFISRGERARINLLVQMFGRWVPMQVDADQVEGMGEEA